ncbi:MAG TPA: cytidine deaminase [Clostridiaceae bacterium]|nr:cytidine deaminase [Clostridiaceae bacterium]
MNEQLLNNLIVSAIEASKNSYSPYSKYRVGAALLGTSGRIFTGCNVENASYGATICAELTAVVKAISEGEHKFSALAIHGSSHQPKPNQTYYAYPCGICRQVLSEFAEPDLTVLIVHSENDYLKRTLGELLPDSFGSANLE